MKAAIMRGGKIVADEIEAPKPGAGEVLVKTLACGICEYTRNVQHELYTWHFARNTLVQ